MLNVYLYSVTVANHGGCHYPAMLHARMAPMWQDRGNECGATLAVGQPGRGPTLDLTKYFLRIQLKNSLAYLFA